MPGGGKAARGIRLSSLRLESNFGALPPLTISRRQREY
jgi:hypothetical protein